MLGQKQVTVGRAGSRGAPSRKGAVVDDGKECYHVCGPETKMSERVQPRSDHAGSPWQELPEKWNNIKKTAVTVRQQVAPLQANEVTLLRQRCTAFEAEQQAFWERFRREAPFRYGPRSPPRPAVLETQQHLKSRVTSPWSLCIFLTEDWLLFLPPV